MCYSHMGTPTLPSPLLRFTSEFEMDSGGTVTLLPSDINCDVKGFTNAAMPWMARSGVLKRVALSFTILKSGICKLSQYNKLCQYQL